MSELMREVDLDWYTSAITCTDRKDIENGAKRLF